MAEKYGSKAVTVQRRSVCVDFGVFVDADENTNYQVVSMDVVPAFTVGKNYEIPDKHDGNWVKTNPKIHEDKAVAAQDDYKGEWKGIVRMLKYWNNHRDKPIKPSFLVEVMALECLDPPFNGRFDYEFQSAFATFADRIADRWKDPADLGPPVSDMMTDNKKQDAREKLKQASRQATLAIDLVRRGKNGDALQAWRTLFGPKFPLS